MNHYESIGDHRPPRVWYFVPIDDGYGGYLEIVFWGWPRRPRQHLKRSEARQEIDRPP